MNYIVVNSHENRVELEEELGLHPAEFNGQYIYRIEGDSFMHYAVYTAEEIKNHKIAAHDEEGELDETYQMISHDPDYPLFRFIVNEDDITQNNLVESLNSLRDCEHYLSVAQLTSYKASLEKYHDTVNDIIYVILPYTYEFPNEMNHIHPFENGSIVTYLALTGWTKVSADFVLVAEPPAPVVTTTAMAFNGVDQYGLSSSAIAAETSYTAVVRFKYTDNGGWERLLCLSGVYPDTFDMKIYGPNGTMYITTYDTGMSGSHNCQDNTFVEDTWYTVLTTFDKDNVKMYTDQALIKNNNRTFTGLNTGACKVQVGSSLGNSEFLEGSVQFSAIYKGNSMTDDQRNAISPIDGSSPEFENLDTWGDCLVAYRHGENLAAGVETDLKGNADLTMTNMSDLDVVTL